MATRTHRQSSTATGTSMLGASMLCRTEAEQDALLLQEDGELSTLAVFDSRGEAFLTRDHDRSHSWYGVEEDGCLHCCACHACGDFCSWSSYRPTFPVEVMALAHRGPLRLGRVLDADQLAGVPARTVVRATDGTIAGRVDEHRGVVLGDERTFPLVDPPCTGTGAVERARRTREQQRRDEQMSNTTAAARARLHLVPTIPPEPLSRAEALAETQVTWEEAYDSLQQAIKHIVRLNDLREGPICIDVEIPQALQEASALWVTAELLASQLEDIHAARDVLTGTAGGQ